MPSLDSLLGTSDYGVGVMAASEKAVLAWRRINDKPTSITVYRAGAAQAAQTVRIEYKTRANPQQPQKNIGEASVRELVVMGVQDHASVTATSLAKGDTFDYLSETYVITDVITWPGEVQAKAEKYS